MSLVLEAAYSLVAKRAVYEFLEELCNPPDRLNCYLFVWWVFKEYAGIEMPKTMLKQLYRGEPVNDVGDLTDVGLIFATAAWGDYRDSDRAREGVGHNGILTKKGTVIHACGKRRRVVVDTLAQFLSERELRGIFRIT